MLLSFIKENRDQPFFLYYATWLVPPHRDAQRGTAAEV